MLFDEIKAIALQEINTRKIVKTMPDFDLEIDSESYENIIRGATEAVFRNWCPQI